MRDKRNWPTIGYFNLTLQYDWAECPWQGAVMAAEQRRVNLLAMIGKRLKARDLILQQGNTVYELSSGGFVDALLFWKGHLSYYLDDNELEAYLAGLGVPVVLLEGQLPGYTTVDYGNYEGIRMLMDHLIRVHGYKKIGFMGRGEKHPGFERRYQAYCDALKDYNLAFDPHLTAPWLSWIPEYGGRSCDTLLDEWIPRAMDAGLEAIIGMADPIAWWVMERMERLGIKVPRDAAVVGFDAYTNSKFCNPPLTTIDPDFTALGSLGLHTIVDILEGKQVPEKVMVPPKLLLARTCGCLEENVARAAGIAVKGPAAQDSYLSQMQAILTDEDRGLLAKLYSAFVADIKGEPEIPFLLVLEKILFRYINERKELQAWQDVITLFSKFKTTNQDRAARLCHQARVLIGDISTRQEGWKRIESVFKIITERKISTEILTNFQLEKLLDILIRNMTKLGVRRAYLTMFKESFTYHFPERLPEEASLILAFDEKGRLDLEPGGKVFPTYEIIPRDIRSNERTANWTLFPLAFRENQIGFIVFETGPELGLTCEFLSAYISSSLRGVIQMDEIIKAYAGLEQTNSMLQRELAVARNVQTALLPDDIRHELFDIAAVMKTAHTVRGDYYDIFRVQGRDWIMVGDVSGNGVRAGLMMMMVQTSIRLLVKQFPDLSPSRLLSLVNNVIRDNIKRLNDNQYMTINILTHKEKGEFIYSGMHLPMLIYRQANKSIERIETRGMWLGGLDHIADMNTDRSFVLLPGDCLLLYTDGLTEAGAKNGGFYGLNRLAEIFLASGHKSSAEIVRDILAELDESGIDDDVTVIAIKWPGSGGC